MKSKKQKKITRRERKEFLSPLYIQPAKKKDSEGPVSKIIQYKYEFNLDWYLLTFKDHRRQPEWQQYRNLEGCNEMIRDFWIREEAGANPMVGPFGSSKFLRSSTQNNRRKARRSNYSSHIVNENYHSTNFIPNKNENDYDNIYLREPNRPSMHNTPLTQIQENTCDQTIRPAQIFCKSKATGILNMKNEWTGSLEKGQNKSFLATVLLKPYPGHCYDLYSLFKIIGKTLWIRDSIPITFAKQFIQPVDNIFTIEAAYDDDISKLYIECALMEWSEKAGIVWIDESMSSFYIIFPNSDTIYLNLGCLTRPTASFFAIFKTLPSFQSILQQKNLISLEYNHIFTDQQLMIDGIMEAENFLNLMRYHQLIEWFKNKPKFMEYSEINNLERSEFLNAIKCLGGIHLNEFDDDIEYVFIHKGQGLQPNYIPHLMNLKNLPNCKFIGYGDGCWPPDSSVNLEEWFPHGGFITITAQTFNKQDHIFDRLYKVFQYQSTLDVSSTWKVVICKNVEDNLAKNFEKFRCRQSLISSRMIQLSLKEGSSRYFETDELFYSKEKLKPMSIIKSLSFHMIKLHNKHWKKTRHFIIICEPEEKYNDIIPVPGVDRLTLKEFELKFGSSERILLQ